MTLKLKIQFRQIQVALKVFKGFILKVAIDPLRVSQVKHRKIIKIQQKF